MYEVMIDESMSWQRVGYGLGWGLDLYGKGYGLGTEEACKDTLLSWIALRNSGFKTWIVNVNLYQLLKSLSLLYLLPSGIRQHSSESTYLTPMHPNKEKFRSPRPGFEDYASRVAPACFQTPMSNATQV